MWEDMKKPSELVLAMLAAAILTIACVMADVFGRVVSLVAVHKAWRVDGAIFFLLFSGVAAGVLFVRRSRDLGLTVACETAEQEAAARTREALSRGTAERQLLEASVHANEQRLESILATAYQSIVTIDGCGMITQWNRHAELTFGWLSDEVIGLRLSDIIVPIEARAAHEAGLARFMMSRTAKLIGSQIEVTALRRNGTVFPIELSLSATNIGEDWQFTALIQDISERRAQIELFENAFDHAPIGMALVALDGRLLKLNAAFCDLIGYEQAEAVTLDFQAITHADDLDRDLHLLKQLLAGDLPRYQMEKRYIRKSGRIVWVRLSVSLALREDGTPRHFISQVQDLSVERESEDRYRLLADSASDMVGLYAMDSRCLYMSPSSLRILGYQPQELVGEPAVALAFMPREERSTIIEAVKHLKGAPADFTVTRLTRLRHKDGRLLHIEFVARLVASEDGGCNIVSACRDVTERVEVQRALEERSRDLIRAHLAAERSATITRQAEALFRGIFDNSPDLNFVYDVVDGAFPITIRNEAAERALAATANAPDEDLATLISPSQATTRKMLEEVVSSGEARYMIEQDTTAGQDSTFDVRLVPLRDDGGHVHRVFVSKRDISVLKRAEQTALQANVLMQSAEKIAHMGYVVYDLITDTMTWSPEVWTILDLDPATDAPTADKFKERRHPDDRARAVEKLAAAIADGLNEYDNDYRLLLPNGEVRHVMTRGTIRREGGIAVSVFGVLVDISELKRAEEKARESDQRYRLMAENATDVIVTSDLEGRTTFVSPASVLVTGHTSEERMYGRAGEIAHPDDLEDLRATFRALKDGAVGKHIRWRARHKTEDRWVWLESSPALLRDPMTQVATGYLDVLRDVTAQKQQEDALAAAKLNAEQAMHSKERFLANMSHELRTPLNSIIGFSRLLNESRGLEPEDQRRVRLVHSAGLALHAVIDNVLDFSKLEADKLTLHCNPFSVTGFFTSTVALLEPQAATRDVRLLVEIDPTVPDRLVGDMGRLRQILLNLLSNAVKFTQDGSVTTRVILIENKDCDARLRIEVIDTGSGIPPERIATLFNRFVQASASTAVKYGGTGLGLAISRQLLRLMGGEIGVFSELEKGSTFWFELTLPVAETLECDDHETPMPAILSLAGKRILVVDDVDLNRELMLALLSSYGCAVDVAENGVGALAALDRHAFDLILMDCQMPVMDGFAATRAIRERAGPVATIPIVALTASAHPEHLARCREAGMNEHLTKPLDPGALESVLGRYLASTMAAVPVPATAPQAAGSRPVPVTVIAASEIGVADNHTAPGATIAVQNAGERPGKPAAAPSLKERYAARRAQTLATLEALIRNGCFTESEIVEVAAMAHNLAGTAGMFGEAELGDAAAALDAGLEHWHVEERNERIREAAAAIQRIAQGGT
jgi:PAS domain S-box-containing protein